MDDAIKGTFWNWVFRIYSKEKRGKVNVLFLNQ